MVDGPCVAQDGRKPVGGDSVGIRRDPHEEPDIRAAAASKAVDQQGCARRPALAASSTPAALTKTCSRRSDAAEPPAKNKRLRSLLLSTAIQSDHLGQGSYRARCAGCQAASGVLGGVRRRPSTDVRLMQSGKPSLLLPGRRLPGLARVLVDVIFEAIERIREEDDTVLLLEQHALVAFEIADYLFVPEFGKLNMLGDAPKLLDEFFVTAADLEGHLVKAIVYDVVGGPALVREVAEPDCPEDGAVITVRATGVCRSDWHAWRGHEAVPLPHIPGHEFAGVIAAVGAQVGGFAPGDRVTAPFVNGCGRCDWCRAGDAQICPDQTQPGFSHPGSFAERVVVRVADVNLVRLRDELDFVSAAALGCRFATAFRALTAYRRVEPEDWVVVFGCGGVGLSAIMIARALGARVIGVDLSAAARARAAELGAVAIEVAETSTAIAELTGAGAHLTVDAVGSAATALAAVSGLRRGGQHVQVGLMLDADALAPLPWELLVVRELRVAGSHGMSAADYPAMLAMITDGRLDLRGLIAERIPLEKAGAAMMAMDNPVAARAGITVAVSDTGG